MINDALEKLPAELEAEVAIAGGGPAGISLALELARRGRRVLLIEGGGVEGPGQGQSVYDGAVTGQGYPLIGSRLRFLGGTTNHWGGWVRPLDAVDFEDKNHFPMPAWPFGPAELEPWYAPAAGWCQVPSTEYDPDAAGLDRRAHVLDFGEHFVNRLFRFSPPTRFGFAYRAELEAEENLDCRVNLNLVGLEQTGERVRAALCRTFDGGRCRVRAEHFVLAMGGLENPRFLLNQSPVPGNQAGLVGACFMDHFGFRAGLLLAREDLRYRRFALGDADLMPVIAPAPELIHAEGLINSCMVLFEEGPDEVLPPGYWTNPGLGHGDAGGLTYRVQLINEPLPHPHSRVELGPDRDALGLKRLRLDWRVEEADFQRIFALLEHFARTLGQQGLGRLRWTEREPFGTDHIPGVGFHHMGTTRMSAGPEWGVADADGRVWDRENLYLAGSSLFPTAGFSNPTLVIVALACRLADHLDRELGAG